MIGERPADRQRTEDQGGREQHGRQHPHRHDQRASCLIGVNQRLRHRRDLQRVGVAARRDGGGTLLERRFVGGTVDQPDVVDHVVTDLRVCSPERREQVHLWCTDLGVVDQLVGTLCDTDDRDLELFSLGRIDVALLVEIAGPEQADGIDPVTDRPAAGSHRLRVHHHFPRLIVGREPPADQIERADVVNRAVVDEFAERRPEIERRHEIAVGIDDLQEDALHTRRGRDLRQPVDPIQQSSTRALADTATGRSRPRRQAHGNATR